MVERPPTRRDNWLSPNAPPEIQALQIEAHKKQLAYEAQRDMHRIMYPAREKGK